MSIGVTGWVRSVDLALTVHRGQEMEPGWNFEEHLTFRATTLPQTRRGRVHVYIGCVSWWDVHHHRSWEYQFFLVDQVAEETGL